MLKIIFENRAAKLVDLRERETELVRLLTQYEKKSCLGNNTGNNFLTLNLKPKQTVIWNFS
jgi:hypothetical protein